MRVLAAVTTLSLVACVSIDDLEIPRLPTPPRDGWRLPLRSRVSPIVEGTTTSGESCAFFLDTGAHWTYVTAAESERLQLPHRGIEARRHFTSDGSLQIDRCARFEGLRVGDVPIPALDAFVFEMPYEITGVLGLTVFGQYPVLFDVGGEEIRLLPENREDFIQRRYGDRRWSDLPLGWWNGTPYVTLACRGKDLRLLFDTGTTSSCVRTKTARALEFGDLGTDEFGTIDAAGAHESELHGFHVEDLALGDWIVEFESWSTEDDTDLTEYPKADGVLGFDVLRRIPFVFDASRDQVSLLEPEAPSVRALRIDEEAESLAVLGDSFPANRKFALTGMAKPGKPKYAPLIASHLDDVDPSVSAAAARALAVFAKTSWSAESQVEQARLWWQAHRDDAEFSATKR